MSHLVTGLAIAFHMLSYVVTLACHMQTLYISQLHSMASSIRHINVGWTIELKACRRQWSVTGRSHANASSYFPTPATAAGAEIWNIWWDNLAIFSNRKGTLCCSSSPPNTSNHELLKFFTASSTAGLFPKGHPNKVPLPICFFSWTHLGSHQWSITNIIS